MKKNLNKKLKTISTGLMAIGVGTGAIIGVASCGSDKKPAPAAESNTIKKPTEPGSSKEVNETSNWDVALPTTPIYKANDGGYTTNIANAHGYVAATPATVVTLPAATADSTITVDGAEVASVAVNAYDQTLPTDKLYLAKEGDVPEYTTNVENALGYTPVKPATPAIVTNKDGEKVPLSLEAGTGFHPNNIQLNNPADGEGYMKSGAEFNPDYLKLALIPNDNLHAMLIYNEKNTDQLVDILNTTKDELNAKLSALKASIAATEEKIPSWYKKASYGQPGKYSLIYSGINVNETININMEPYSAREWLIKQYASQPIPSWFTPGTAEIPAVIPEAVVPTPADHPHILIINGETKTEYNAVVDHYEWNLSADQKAGLFLKAGVTAEAPEYVTDQTLAEGYVAAVTPDPITPEALVTAAKANSNAITIDGTKHTLVTPAAEDEVMNPSLSVFNIYI